MSNCQHAAGDCEILQAGQQFLRIAKVVMENQRNEYAIAREQERSKTSFETNQQQHGADDFNQNHQRCKNAGQPYRPQILLEPVIEDGIGHTLVDVRIQPYNQVNLCQQKAGDQTQVFVHCFTFTQISIKIPEGMMPVSAASRNTDKEIIMKTALLILGLTSLLVACSPSDPEPKVAEDQREVLDQVKAVEDVLQQSAEKNSQQVDEQTQ